jgi:peptidoglycan/LPS O-acetylase OafA/YrhL
VPVNTPHEGGPVLATAATALWAVAIATGFTTAPEDGVNGVAAFLGLLAIPLSIGTSLALLSSWRSDAEAGREEHPVARRTGAVLAVTSMVCLAGALVIAPMTESVELALASSVVLVVGIVMFVASSALFALPRNRRDG